MNELAVTLTVGRTTRTAPRQQCSRPWQVSQGPRPALRAPVALIAGLIAMFATGCTELSVGVSRGTPLTQFLSQSRASVTQVYRVVAGDQLTARFYYNPQLDEDLQ